MLNDMEEEEEHLHLHPQPASSPLTPLDTAAPHAHAHAHASCCSPVSVLSGASSTSEILLSRVLTHNRSFVQERAYTPFLTDKSKFKKVVVLTCMDSRLTELLPHALNLKNGDAKIIKVAGAMVRAEIRDARQGCCWSRPCRRIFSM
jgi:hypothetical protein